MPGILRLSVSTDVADLSRDLRAFGDDLDKPLRDALEYGANAVANAAKPLMRFRPSGAWPTSSGARYGHIQDYYRATVATLSAAVVSDHPAAEVWEYGGDIHPAAGSIRHAAIAAHSVGSPARQILERGIQTIHIPRQQPVANAADAKREEITQHLEQAVDALIEEHGLNG